jgi:hypothetical protein
MASISASRGFSGSAPSFVQPFLIHETGVEITDLLRCASRLLIRLASELFNQRVEVGLSAFVELDERSVHRSIRGISVFVSHAPLT